MSSRQAPLSVYQESLTIGQIRDHVRKLKKEIDGVESTTGRLLPALNKALTASYALLGIMRKMTGNEDVDKAIASLQRLIAMLHMAIATYQLFLRTTGPIGILLTAISAIGVGYSLADEVGSYA